MRWVTSQNGRLHVVPQPVSQNQSAAAGVLQPRAIHELLFDPRQNTMPTWPALAWARGVADRAADQAGGRMVVWCDTDGTLYPPAAWRGGIGLDRFFMLRLKPVDVFWAAAECLRCRGVAAVVATVPSRMTSTQARRFQLAAEEGGSAGILLRPQGRGDDIYAAATRWVISPAAGDGSTQRWNATLVHGPGGHTGRDFLLESARDDLARFRVTGVHRDTPADPPAVLSAVAASGA